MEGHKEKLMKLCRLCCLKTKNMENKDSFPEEIKTFKIQVMKNLIMILRKVNMIFIHFMYVMLVDVN